MPEGARACAPRGSSGPRLVNRLHQLDARPRSCPAGRRGRPCPSREGDEAVGVGGGGGVVGDHDHRLAEARRPPGAAASAPPRWPSSRGCRSARRRRRPPVARPGPGRRRRAAAGRRTAPRAGACGRSSRPTVCDQLVEPLPVGLAAGDESGSTMFSSAVRTGSRLKNWKTKPSLSRRSRVSSPSSSPVELLAVEEDAARGRFVEPGEDVHERRLARARGAHDRREPALLEAGADPGQGVDRRLACAVAFGHRLGDDQLAVRTGGTHDLGN